MPLNPGTRFGPYEILAPLGAGGMGEVYRARDTQLDREVAIKVLPSAVADDRERLIRFEREAKVLASLNHPNIAQIYGLADSGDTRALVMELVAGSTLSVPQPIETALKYAKEIAEALEAAHEKGVTHRDLKPANIMITPEGVVKVLDFGLASVPGREDGGDPPNSPTMTMAATRVGMIMGTAAYMSPEQAAGKAVDRRSDIWSFGVVLWETLAGTRLFHGETISHTLADVLRKPIDFAKLPASTPVPIEELVKRCLDRDVKTRLQSIGEARIAIQRYAADPNGGRVEPRPFGRRRERVWMGLATLFLLTTALTFLPRSQETAVPTRFEVRPGGNAILASLISAGRPRISPDGRKLAFVAGTPGGRQMIWVRPLDSVTAQPLAGTEGAGHVFWSWDSQFLAFFADGKLKKVGATPSSAAQVVQVVCDVPDGRSGSWGRKEVILFNRFSGGPTYRVPAAGGTPIPATTIDRSRQENSHRWASFLPDGKHFMYKARGNRGELPRVYLASLDSTSRTHLLDADSNVDYAPPGYLLFVRDRTLMARAFDVQRLKLAGEAVPVVQRVGYAAVSGGNFSVSETGVLAYSTSDDTIITQLAWYDRTGKRLSSVDEPGGYRQPQVSRDGTRVAVERLDPRARDGAIWLYDLARGSHSRLTFGSGWQYIPVASPDMGHVLFSAGRDFGSFYQTTATGTGNPERVLSAQENAERYLCDWSQDGRFLVFVVAGENTQEDLWTMPMFGDRKPFPIVQTPFSETQGQFSPDGKWFAYASDENGRPDVYVQAFPPSGIKRQLSVVGGSQPRWRRDGKELYYIGSDRKLMAVPVKSLAILDAGGPTPLFQTRISSELGPYSVFSYAVTGDGGRFLLNEPVGDEASPPISVVLNWMAELKK